MFVLSNKAKAARLEVQHSGCGGYFPDPGVNEGVGQGI